MTGIAVPGVREDRAGATGTADLARVAECLRRSYGDRACGVARWRARAMACSGDRDLAAIWAEIADRLSGDAAERHP